MKIQINTLGELILSKNLKGGGNKYFALYPVDWSIELKVFSKEGEEVLDNYYDSDNLDNLEEIVKRFNSIK